MIIGIEAERANTPQKTGVEHYAKQLIEHLAELDKKNEYRLYLRNQPEAWFLKLPLNFKIKVMPFPVFWTQLRISWEMLFHPVDALMIPASALPFIHPRKSVITIHDIGWRYFPESFTWFMRIFLEWSTRFAIRRASNIIAVSISTKRDIVKHYKVNEEKIAVVYHGYETTNQLINKSANQQISLPSKYILFLSTLQPRKNLEGLIKAFTTLKLEHPELEHKLVIAGKPGWKYESIMRKIKKNNNFVVYLNHITDEDRFNVLSKAELLVLPSFYEGFGMQILESFQADVPVATSKVSSMPEVAGEAAVYFDPHDIKDIKKAISLIIFDKSLAENLKIKGKERLNNFSWKKCAQETLQVLRN